jgi:hypothetical protein
MIMILYMDIKDLSESRAVANILGRSTCWGEIMMARWLGVCGVPKQTRVLIREQDN